MVLLDSSGLYVKGFTFCDCKAQLFVYVPMVIKKLRHSGLGPRTRTHMYVGVIQSLKILFDFCSRSGFENTLLIPYYISNEPGKYYRLKLKIALTLKRSIYLV